MNWPTDEQTRHVDGDQVRTCLPTPHLLRRPVIFVVALSLLSFSSLLLYLYLCYIISTVAWLFHGCNTGVSWLLHGCCMVVSWL